MESKDYLKDITEIKNLMNKSSRFISLSGLSGILAGIYALIGSAVAYWLVMKYSNGTLIYVVYNAHNVSRFRANQILF